MQFKRLVKPPGSSSGRGYNIIKQMVSCFVEFAFLLSKIQNDGNEAEGVLSLPQPRLGPIITYFALSLPR